MAKLLLVLALIGVCQAAPIKIMALDQNSKATIHEIDSTRYVKTLILLRNALDKQVVTGLDGFKDQGAYWEMKKFTLGLGATGEIGIGPWKFGKALKQRFVYVR